MFQKVLELLRHMFWILSMGEQALHKQEMTSYRKH